MKVEQLNGVGPKTANILHKIDIFSVKDLLEYYPYRYNFINIKKLSDALDNETIYVSATIITNPKVMYIKKNFNILSFNALVSDDVVNVKIFNRAFMKNNLTIDKELVLVGKYDRLKNTFTASDIKFNIESNTIEAVYHLTEGLNSNLIKKLINNALLENINIEDLVPEYYNKEYKLIDKNTAIKYIHKPSNKEEIKKAKLKLIYEELFNYTFKINMLKLKNEKALGIKRNINKKEIDSFINKLPFELTTDQLSVIDEILDDLSTEKRMNRLVLGDVGSGKTIVAFIATLANYLSNYQTAFMAPTEILAKQHFENAKNFFKDKKMNIKILTGSTTKKEKDIIYKELREGKIDIIIGTHSLINEKIEFKNLGLVITDEQHLFGVKQRTTLQDKGSKNADTLYLSATPIPRTYALTIYGDLDLSLIKTKPKLRKEIITKVKKDSEIKDVLYKMLEEIKLGHQIFVVSPLIEQNEELDLTSVLKLEEKLKLAFKDKVSIEIVHGKMKQQEKDKIMNDFQTGKIKILISTTVIEVGIDIPNATMMVIFNAERFGLAALHQLRGRVGRNDLQSYCYLISKTDNKRLNVMEGSSDGFYISEKDFEQRGQGDLFGVKQSGDISFKIADIRSDAQILLQASKDSYNYIKKGTYMDNNYYKNLYEEIFFLD